MVKVALVDDHALLRSGLAGILSGLGYSVLYECGNGKQLIETLTKDNEPDVVIMDINMPEMNGFETTLWLKQHYPLINVIALSMFDDENSIIRMLKNGARGYILKDISPTELKRAIDDVVKHGFYYSDLITGPLLHSIRGEEEESDQQQVSNLKEREVEFLKLACSEMTYKEIAEKMFLSSRTIDGYRDELFQKLGIKNRVGLVLFAIKNRMVHFN